MTRSEISAAVDLAKRVAACGGYASEARLIATALVALHAESERWRPVVEAAVEWQRTYRLPFAPTGCFEHRRSSLMLAEAIDTARQGAE